MAFHDLAFPLFRGLHRGTAFSGGIQAPEQLFYGDVEDPNNELQYGTDGALWYGDPPE